MVSLNDLVELVSNIRLRSFTSGDEVTVWIAIMFVTTLSVIVYSFDVNPVWMALFVIGGGITAATAVLKLPLFIGPAAFLAGAAIILYRRYR